MFSYNLIIFIKLIFLHGVVTLVAKKIPGFYLSYILARIVPLEYLLITVCVLHYYYILTARKCLFK